MENGIRHNIAENGWIRVRSGTSPDGSAVVEVSNSGPVIPRYEVPGLFEPFHRWRRSAALPRGRPGPVDRAGDRAPTAATSTPRPATRAA